MSCTKSLSVPVCLLTGLTTSHPKNPHPTWYCWVLQWTRASPTNRSRPFLKGWACLRTTPVDLQRAKTRSLKAVSSGSRLQMLEHLPLQPRRVATKGTLAPLLLTSTRCSWDLPSLEMVGWMLNSTCLCGKDPAINKMVKLNGEMRKCLTVSEEETDGERGKGGIGMSREV